jgi:TPR repeat protein
MTTFHYLLRISARLFAAPAILFSCPAAPYANTVDDILSYEREQGKGSGIEKLVSKARAGDARSQAILGEVLLGGYIRGQSVPEALEWLQKSGENGNAEAYRRLAQLYESGQFVGEDIQKAIYWYKKAYESGMVDASQSVARLYKRVAPDNFEQALFWYRKGADDGVVDSQCLLGWFYSRGQGVPLDYAESMRWFLKGLEQRDHLSYSYRQGSEAMIAIYYDRGLGVAKDTAEAIRWYRMSAGDGDTFSNYKIGSFYEQGEGVPRDLVEAMRRYEISAEEGYAPAQYRLGLGYDRAGPSRDPVQAIKWLTLAIQSPPHKRVYILYESAFPATRSELDLDTRLHAERDLARVRRAVSAKQLELGERLAESFELKIPPPLTP